MCCITNGALCAYQDTSETVASGANVTFANVAIQYGRNVTLTPGSDVVNIGCPGFYRVDFSGSASGSTAGNVAVDLLLNNVAVGGASATAYSAGATDGAVNVSFSAIVQVTRPCCPNTSGLPAALAVQNAGVAAVFTNAAINVTRVG